MFTKLEPRSWIKIEVARCRSTQECFQGLREVCVDAALSYRTVAQWVKVFREGRSGQELNKNHYIAKLGIKFIKSLLINKLRSPQPLITLY